MPRKDTMMYQTRSDRTSSMTTRMPAKRTGTKAMATGMPASTTSLPVDVGK